MAFIAYDETNLTTATSYVSVVYADDYFTYRLNSSDWTGTDEEKQKALIMATRRIDSLSYLGVRATETQLLKFPRRGMPRIDGVDFNSDTVLPEDIKKATCEAAIIMLSNDTTATSQTNIKREKLDVLETEYFTASAANQSYSLITPQFWDYVDDFTKPDNYAYKG